MPSNDPLNELVRRFFQHAFLEGAFAHRLKPLLQPLFETLLAQHTFHPVRATCRRQCIRRHARSQRGHQRRLARLFCCQAPVVLVALHRIAIHLPKRLRARCRRRAMQRQQFASRGRPHRAAHRQRRRTAHQHAGALVHPLPGRQRLTRRPQLRGVLAQSPIQCQRIIAHHRRQARRTLRQPQHALRHA